ncbi:MAG: glycosyltransferase family 2 protein [Prevotella sp.]|nr:glycosyltransferase family 2 protein [Prevotella sp.]
MNIAILLTTYNGEKYLQQQIDSLYNQTYKDWTLYVHDDGSKDNTLNILHKNAELHDNMVILDYETGLGARDNFFSLFQKVDADYYMFCDQDDVWFDNKVEVSLCKMKETEANHPDTPIIVHSDLLVVDQNLQTIHESYWSYVGMKPNFMTNFDRLAAGNFVTGCTMIMNKMVKKITLPLTRYSYMHDAWITACTIKEGGIIVGIDKVLLYYRQHTSNLIGAPSSKRFNIRYKIFHAKETYNNNKVQYMMLKSLGYKSLLTYIKNKILYKMS